MRFTKAIIAAASLLATSLAQDEGIPYTDPASGIVFNTWTQPDLTFGLALPPTALTTDATEFLGLLTCKSPTPSTGWCGLSLGGSMVNNLLLLAYPSDSHVLTSLRWATTYGPPVPYTNPSAKISHISSTVNSTHYSVIFRCVGCLSWSQGGESGTAPTTPGFLVLGWAYATASPGNPGCAGSSTVRRHDSQGVFGAVFNSAVARAEYSVWAARATTNTPQGGCGGDGDGGVTTSVVTLPSRPTATATATASIGFGNGNGNGGCAKTYTVVAGDYCYLIATSNGLSLDQLLGINPGLVCNPLQIGTVVCLRRG
ncbi:hypothetical protein QBC47DRAFT_429380 [Echria macrotheca]|uniref:LysM domain-containing protein n=1 Tax=Echria macrotheca TaxID=438768 RepID=A0AAJ0B9G8_9PEZI|nr:hypothetical protein QBC47DRAFT_429380 [Echria macrotheca]